MCGEKVASSMITAILLGSPPRVRGKVALSNLQFTKIGITPACAGKRTTASAFPASVRDHPRVCGEKVINLISTLGFPGSPPRVRGKGLPLPIGQRRKGITPACAGKSGYKPPPKSKPKDHPRVCGEKRRRSALKRQVLGSPPRVRGKDSSAETARQNSGITPACAGKSKSDPLW